MHFERSNFGFFIAFIVIGGIMGGALGNLLATVAPAVGIINKSLTGPIGFNLELIDFHIRLNLASIIGIITGILIFRKA